jgi:hypothetical protein
MAGSGGRGGDVRAARRGGRAPGRRTLAPPPACDSRQPRGAARAPDDAARPRHPARTGGPAPPSTHPPPPAAPNIHLGGGRPPDPAPAASQAPARVRHKIINTGRRASRLVHSRGAVHARGRGARCGCARRRPSPAGGGRAGPGVRRVRRPGPARGWLCLCAWQGSVRPPRQGRRPRCGGAAEGGGVSIQGKQQGPGAGRAPARWRERRLLARGRPRARVGAGPGRFAGKQRSERFGVFALRRGVNQIQGERAMVGGKQRQRRKES